MRFSLLVALVVTAAVPSVAQPVVGVRASGVYSNVTSSGTPLGNAVGLGIGVFVEAPVTSTLSVVADVGYVQGGAGSEVVQTSPTTPDPSTGRLDYLYRTHALTLAPALSATLRTDDLSPSLFLGPRVDLKLAEQTRIDGGRGDTDDFPDTAIGLAGGSTVANDRVRVGLRASYLWGVDSAIRQSTLELRVGVTL